MMSGSALFLQWEAWNLISNYILLILLKELFSHIKNFFIMWSFPLDFMTISMFVQNRILAHNVNLKSREGNSFIRFYSILRICKWIYSVGNAEPHRTALVGTEIKLNIERSWTSCVGNAFIVYRSSGNDRHINTVNGFWCSKTETSTAANWRGQTRSYC